MEILKVWRLREKRRSMNYEHIRRRFPCTKYRKYFRQKHRKKYPKPEKEMPAHVQEFERTPNGGNAKGALHALV